VAEQDEQKTGDEAPKLVKGTKEGGREQEPAVGGEKASRDGVFSKIYARGERFFEQLLEGVFPPLERVDRVALVNSLTEGSRWSMNFGVMLGCSVLIAGLGLLQNSVAVIIGAMLVAPLMTPLIGTGLALVQGNFKLLAQAGEAMFRGSVVSLFLGVALRVLTPGHELSTEVLSRGAPNILDLLIAFLAGVAAGYAMARPKLSGALPGVAISVALVPPLAAAGIALGSQDWMIALGALLLLATNMVAIVLGSAMVFRIHGIKTPESQKTTIIRMKRIMLGLGFALVLMTAPLVFTLMDQLRMGQAMPESLTLSEDLWFKLHDRLEREEGIDFITGVRASAERPEDIALLISASRRVSGKLLAEIDQIIDEGIGEDVKVKINVLQQGEVGDPSNLPALDGGEDDSEPAINE
jgi:uncharacterized hydrophobic protein (TIGR00271 family)